MLRYLIKDVTLTKREQVIEVRIRWQTEALTDLTVPRPKRAADARRTDPQVVARVRELAPTHTATHIALLLKRSNGFVRPTPFPLIVPKGLASVPVGNEAMGGTQPWLQQNC